MTDYLGEVGRTGRCFAIVGLAITIPVLAALNLLVVIGSMNEKIRAEIPGPLIGSGLICGFLSVVSVWVLLRLLCHTRSANRLTMMPVWFIQMIGVAFGAGIVFAAIKGDQPLFILEGMTFALTLILLPRLVQRRRSHEYTDEPENSADNWTEP